MRFRTVKIAAVIAYAFLICFVAVGQDTKKKVSELQSLGSLSSDDVFMVIDNPAGASKKIPFANVVASIQLPWSQITGKPSTFAPAAHATSHNLGGSDAIAPDWSQVANKPSTFTPASHTHDYTTGITGKPSTFAPAAHATSHNLGGSDAIAPDWSQLANKPSTFAPSSHTHPESEVTSLVSDLNGKQPVDADLTAIGGISKVRGDLITAQGATPGWDRLAKGTQYQPLQAGANEPVYDAVHLDQPAAVTGVLPAGNLPTAAADGSTKGVAAFGASDFDAASGVISIDYANGQAADASHKGFLSASDYSKFASILQNSQSTAYTTVLGDAGKQIYHPSADTTARTFTIDSNANVPYPIGTPITFVNDCSAGVVTIAITSDTLVLAGAGTTGSRTLAACGVATALKVAVTRWIINGTGL